MTFQVGQKVVCIGDCTSEPVQGEVLVRKGEVYTVRGIVHFNNLDGPGLYLHEIRNPVIDTTDGRVERAFGIEGFRPVVERKTDISVFTEMLNNVPLHERERA